MQHHYASTCAANQFAAMQGQFGGVPYPPQMGAPFGMFPGASAGLFRPPSGSNLTGLSDPGLCASQQQQQSLQQQHSLQQQPSLQQPQHTEGTPQGTADSALTCSRDPAQQHSDRRRSSSNPCEHPTLLGFLLASMLSGLRCTPPAVFGHCLAAFRSHRPEGQGCQNPKPEACSIPLCRYTQEHADPQEHRHPCS